MVKGIAKRVVMVKSLKRSIFEQAIFVIKDEAYANGKLSADKILSEASGIAERYLSTKKHSSKQTEFYLILSAVAGGAFVGIIWALFGLFS